MMRGPGQQRFVEACLAADLRSHLGALTDDALHELATYLADRGETEAVPGEVLAAVMAESFLRFLKR